MKVDIAENFPSVSLKARQIYICSAGWVTNSIAVLVLLDMRIARRSVVVVRGTEDDGILK